VALKAVSREMGAGLVPEPLAHLVADELALASEAVERDGDRAGARAVAAGSFRTLVARYGPDAPPSDSGLRRVPDAGR
jgi:hypothetical protein